MPRRFFTSRVAALCAIGLSACSAIVDADPRKLGPAPVPCDPSVPAPCVCSDGSMRTQQCNALGRYDACPCTGGPAAGAAAAAMLTTN